MSTTLFLIVLGIALLWGMSRMLRELDSTNSLLTAALALLFAALFGITGAISIVAAALRTA